MDALTSEIMGAHSPAIIHAKMKTALMVIDQSINKNDYISLKLGVDLMVQAFYRFELLKQAEHLTKSIEGEKVGGYE